MNSRRLTKAQQERLNSARERLAAYRQAELAILSSQEYRNGTFINRRAELEFVQKAISELEAEVQSLESGGKRYAFRVRITDC